MNRLLAATVVAFFSQAALAGDSVYFKNVSASFDAMLHHAPYAGQTVTTVVRGDDTAANLIHAALRGERPAASTDDSLYFRNVIASFDAMLHHVPYAGKTATTFAREDDLAADLIHAALRGERSVQLALGRNAVAAAR